MGSTHIRSKLLRRRFGHLKVLSYEKAEPRPGHTGAACYHFYRCLCDCGKEVVVKSTSLVGGHVKSCGCFQYVRESKRMLSSKRRPRCKCGKPVERNGRFWRKVCSGCRPGGKYRGESLEAVRERARRRRLEIKRLVVAHYGGKCACCPESELELMTIDHKNNDGAEHRLGRKQFFGIRVYQWLIRNAFPKGFQVLCWNCNISKHLGNGVCIHQRRNNECSAKTISRT